MKKTLIFLLTIFALSCKTYTALRVPSSEFKTTYRNILIIPVFTDSFIIPEENDNVPAFNVYSNEYKMHLINRINENKPEINSAVEKILKDGKYKFNIIKFTGDPKNYISAKKNSRIFNKFTWEYNYDYYISQENAAKLLSETKADAILLQYINVYKGTYVHTISGYGYTSTVIYPCDYLNYNFLIYNNKGTVLAAKSVNITSLQYLDAGFFSKDKMLCVSQENLKKKIDKESLGSIVYDGLAEFRIEEVKQLD